MKKPNLRRYSEVRPTEADADNAGCVAALEIEDRKVINLDLAMFTRDPAGYSHWCRVSEIMDIINCDTTEEDSGWVYAKDRLPTEEDGRLVLWMADVWSQPMVFPVKHFGQYDDGYIDLGIRWHRLPPDPPKKPRESPAVAPTEFPAFVTLRDGSHAIVHGRHPDEQSTTLLGGIVNELRTLALDCPHWYASTGKAHSDPKKLNKHDIVHVGGWLTAEELEAKRNEA